MSCQRLQILAELKKFESRYQTLQSEVSLSLSSPAKHTSLFISLCSRETGYFVCFFWRIPQKSSIYNINNIFLCFIDSAALAAQKFCLKKFCWRPKLQPDYFAAPELCHWTMAARDCSTLLVNIIQNLHMVAPNDLPCMHS